MNKLLENTPEKMAIIENGQKRESTIDFSSSVKSIKNHWKRIATVVVVCTSAAIALTFLMPPKYSATSTMLIKAFQGSSVLDVNTEYSGRDEFYPTQIELLNSRLVLERAVTILKFDKDPDFNGDNESLALTDEQKIVHAANEISKDLTISDVRKTQLLRVSYESTVPANAANVANAIAEAFITLHIEHGIKASQIAQKWTEEKLVELQAKIDALNEKSNAFLKKNKLLTYRTVGGIETDELASSAAHYADAKQDRITAKANYDLVKSIKDENLNEIATLPILSDNAKLQELHIANIKARETLVNLEQNYGPRSEQVRKAKSDVASVEQLTHSVLKELRVGLYKKYQSTLKIEQNYAASVQNEKKNFSQLEVLKKQYANIKTDIDKTKELYKKIYERNQEQILLSSYKGAGVEVVEYATVPFKPMSSNKALIAVMALLASLIGAMLFYIVKAGLNNTVNSMTQLRSRLGLRALAEFTATPEGSTLASWSKTTIDNEHLSECAHALRAELILDKQTWQVIGVGSTLAGEDRSLVSHLLAHSFSKDQKTVLLDLNYRDPLSLSVCLFEKERDAAWKEKQGAAEVMAGKLTADKATITLNNGLSFIPRGKLTQPALLMLSSSQLTDMLTALRTQYDRVIVDLPSLGNDKDALLISQHLDGVVYVVREGFVPANNALISIDRLTDNETPVIGGVLTSTATEKVKSA